MLEYLGEKFGWELAYRYQERFQSFLIALQLSFGVFQCNESTRKLRDFTSVSSELQFGFLEELSDVRVVPGEVVRTRHSEHIDLSQLLETCEGDFLTEIIPVGIGWQWTGGRRHA